MWNEEKLDRLLTTPSARLIADIEKLAGDIMVLGAGGKMGPTLCLLAKNACRAAGVQKRVIAVSRFGDASAAELLRAHDVEVISCDLLAPARLTRCLTVRILFIWRDVSLARTDRSILHGR